MKRILCVLLVVLMCLTAAPLGGFAETDFSVTASAATELAETGQCGENVYWNYNSATGELIISGTGPMYDYNITNSPFYFNTIIRYLVIENGVTSIGDYSFYYCKNLISATLGNTVVTTGCESFSNCENLKSVVLPESLTTIGPCTFRSCHKLNNVTIPNSVTSLTGAFEHCNSLTSIVIPDNVTTIKGAFSFCTSLTSITIGDGVTAITRETFRECTSLTSLTLGSNVISIEDYAFYCCYNLASVTIPATIKTIEHSAFYYCFDLTDVYYEGTEKQWKNVYINDYRNDELLNATIHFENEIETPTECEHNWSAKQTGTNSTCTVPGKWAHYYCTLCGFRTKDKDANPLVELTDLNKKLADHTYADATCTEPKTCTVCGETDGSAFGHDWTDATCTEPKTCTVCGETDGSALGHNYTDATCTEPKTCATCGTTDGTAIGHNWKAATCTEPKTCTACGTTDGSAPGHNLWAYPSAEATCTHSGYISYYRCSVCDKYFKDSACKFETTKEDTIIPKTDHKFTTYTLTKDATCLANAKETATCDVCNYVTHTRDIPGTQYAHTFKNYVSDGNATCISDGTMTAICETCKVTKDTLVDWNSKNVAPHKVDSSGKLCEICKIELVCIHAYSEEMLITKTPTCTENGKQAIVCLKCNDIKPGTEEILYTFGHVWDKGEVLKAASCKETGSVKYTCINKCGETKTEVIEMQPHTYKEEIIHADCENDGYSIFTCTMCASYYADKVVQAYGHMFETYTYDEGSATCYMDGTKTSICANGCGSTKTVTDFGSKTDHEMLTFKTTKHPTCTEDGEEEAMCFYYDKCGYSELVPIDALGHDYRTSTDDDGNVTYYCKICGDSNGNFNPDAEHKYPDKWHVIIPATCLQEGVAIKVCLDCQDVLTTIVPKVAHADIDDDNRCDICDKMIGVIDPEESDDSDVPESPEETPCDCNCHAGGLKAFFFKFFNFFAKIFDKNARTCACGEAQ